MSCKKDKDSKGCSTWAILSRSTVQLTCCPAWLKPRKGWEQLVKPWSCTGLQAWLGLLGLQAWLDRPWTGKGLFQTPVDSPGWLLIQGWSLVWLENHLYTYLYECRHKCLYKCLHKYRIVNIFINIFINVFMIIFMNNFICHQLPAGGGT